MSDNMFDNRCKSFTPDGLRLRPGDQPLPTEGEDSVQDALIREIEQRKALGISRYGRALQTFNGRDALRDLLDELLDGATYAMQVRMEVAAVQKRIDAALAEHEANEWYGCKTCSTAGPCRTRQILTGKTARAEIKVTQVDPVQEVVCSPDAKDYVREHLQFSELQGPAGGLGELMGLPVYVDDDLPPGTVRFQPREPKQ